MWMKPAFSARRDGCRELVPGGIIIRCDSDRKNGMKPVRFGRASA
jgi:hypothetical protein